MSWRWKDTMPSPPQGESPLHKAPVTQMCKWRLGTHPLISRAFRSEGTTGLQPSAHPSNASMQKGRFRQDWSALVFRDMRFEGEEPKRPTWTTGGKKPAFPGLAPQPFADPKRPVHPSGPWSCLNLFKGRPVWPPPHLASISLFFFCLLEHGHGFLQHTIRV